MIKKKPTEKFQLAFLIIGMFYLTQGIDKWLEPPRIIIMMTKHVQHKHLLKGFNLGCGLAILIC